jgi:methionine-rich copper-binding protein CopC
MKRLALALTLLATPAWSHAHLKSASPPPESTVTTPPTAVTITFTESVEPSFSKIAVQDAAGASVTTGPAALVGGDQTQLTAPLKKLAPGIYKVTWHAVSVDTHKTHGAFTFTIAP